MSTMTPAAPVNPYKPQDFHSGNIVRWCPGCGDYAILNAVQGVLASRTRAPKDYVFVSGIGCSSRFPLYMSTYGFHTIHGRALAVATGVKAANPNMEVWLITGDGDGLSIGGNHLLHALRRNIDAKILLFNNEIYGLTKGQFSPTSSFGMVNKSAPYGNIDQPINPIRVALAAGATFVARTSDNDMNHMKMVLERAADHKGSAFVEILQNCVIFNDKVHEDYYGVKTRKDSMLYLHAGEPMIYGKSTERGIAYGKGGLETVEAGGEGKERILVHDESDGNMAYLLASLHYPDHPVPVGIFRDVQMPTYDSLMHAQIEKAREVSGAPDLEKLVKGPKTWVVD
jgi:2-oxoglutarate ferredoxin oxidoreductase subunit beta